MNYCEQTEKEIIKNSKLLKKISEQKFLNYLDKDLSFSTNLSGVIGSDGNCGNFAIALKHHLCNKGTILMSIIDEKSPLGDVTHPIHAVYRINNCVYDFRGRICQLNNETEEMFLKRVGMLSFGQNAMDMPEESIPSILLNTKNERIKKIEQIFNGEDI